LSDPYVAYAFRLFIDYLYTESLSRMTIILLWTALGVMASDVVVGTRRGRHDKSKSKRLQPAQPIEPPVNPRVRFHASKTPEPAPSSRPNRTIDSNPPLTPKQPPEQPKLPGGWSQTNSHSDQEQRSPAWQITSGPELLPSPVCLDDDSDFDTILRDGCHDYEALPSHVRDSFLTAVTQSDKSDSESTVSNGLHGANVLDTWDPSYAGPTSTVGELSVVPQVVDDERTASSDDDLATPTALLLLPAIPTDSHPPANNTSSAVDCDSHVPYKASDEHKGNEIPLPVIIRSTTSPPSPPYTPAKPQASVFHPDIVKLSHNISLPSSASSSDIESDVSTAKRVTLSHVAKYLRAQAKLQEKERARLELERRVAADEGRRTDVIRLDVEADEAAEKAEKFHQKAARKYWKGALRVMPLCSDG
jgi:hypothetical protein